MNYKFLSTIVASFLLQATVLANEPLEKGPTQYRALKQFTKWFVSANAGTQFFIGDHDKQISFGKRLTPHYELSVGKWVNQSFGIRGGINGYEIKDSQKQDPSLQVSNWSLVSPIFCMIKNLIL